ncbi:popeye domain-containing protein 3-like [Glandiceps talaboti]
MMMMMMTMMMVMVMVMTATTSHLEETTTEQIISGNIDREMGTCPEGSDAQNVLFHLGHLGLAIACITPKMFSHHALFLRAVFIVAFLGLFLWAATISCMPDFLGWNLAFFVINCGKVVHIIYTMWPISFQERDEVYTVLFKPIRMPRLAFKKLCDLGNVLSLKKGERYAVEMKTPADQKLSLLLSGSVRVTCEDTHLHTIQGNEFLDTPEWESCKPGYGDTFQVTLTAVEDCIYLSWPRKKLALYLRKEAFTKAIFDNIIGKDIARKLFAMNEYAIQLGEVTTRDDNFMNDIDSMHVSLASGSHLGHLSRLHSIGNSVVSADIGPISEKSEVSGDSDQKADDRKTT